MKDKMILGLIAGFGGAVIMGILDILFNLLPGINTKFIYGVSQLFTPITLAESPYGFFMGLTASLVCGTLAGLSFILVFETTGYDYLFLKGSITGLLLWLLLCGITGTVLGLNMEDTFIDNMVMIIIHLGYGLTGAWLINRFRPRPQEVTGENSRG
ncbi:MAG: hypothetical protein CVU89_02445 [Firmicutes bacterium HGW-Firmicutes-14]|nr:MAG: hypothetical protein CVU89_02445 [Firmicutes bacterium HGW-Firmicutes-14]